MLFAPITQGLREPPCRDGSNTRVRCPPLSYCCSVHDTYPPYKFAAIVVWKEGLIVEDGGKEPLLTHLCLHMWGVLVGHSFT